MADARYIAIEGPIGAGKSTLARILAARTGARLVVADDDENPFLDRFYSDRRAHAFQTQLWYLLTRYQQQASLSQGDLFRRGTVCDYLFAKDRIFASLTLDEQDFRLYDRVYSMLVSGVPRPDLVVYLQARADVLLDRVRRRGRSAEARIPSGYVEEVATAFNQFFFRYAETPLLVVNVSDIDFELVEADREPLLREVERTRGGVHHYVPLATGGLRFPAPSSKKGEA